jgi:hypothetical protein
LFAGAQQHVHFAFRWIGIQLKGIGYELVGLLTAGGGYNDDLIGLVEGTGCARCGTANLLGVSYGRAAEFLNDD